MGEGEALLGSELDRVLQSPYPTTLKALRDIVCSKCTAADINRCVRARLCQVDHLTARVSDALDQWAYVLDLITKLCESTSP